MFNLPILSKIFWIRQCKIPPTSRRVVLYYVLLERLAIEVTNRILSKLHGDALSHIFSPNVIRRGLSEKFGSSFARERALYRSQVTSSAVSSVG